MSSKCDRGDDSDYNSAGIRALDSRNEHLHKWQSLSYRGIRTVTAIILHSIDSLQSSAYQSLHSVVMRSENRLIAPASFRHRQGERRWPFDAHTPSSSCTPPWGGLPAVSGMYSSSHRLHLIFDNRGSQRPKRLEQKGRMDGVGIIQCSNPTCFQPRLHCVSLAPYYLPGLRCIHLTPQSPELDQERERKVHLKSFIRSEL